MALGGLLQLLLEVSFYYLIFLFSSSMTVQSEQSNVAPLRARPHSLVLEARIEAEPPLFAKPNTFVILGLEAAQGEVSKSCEHGEEQIE